MKLDDINQNNAHVLRKTAELVPFPLDDKTKQLIHDMRKFIETLESPFRKPAGLAAPQIGVSLQIMFIQIPPDAKNIRNDVFDEMPLTVFINPSYTPIEEEGKRLDWEGCYSVDNYLGEVPRYKAIHYSYYTENGEKITGMARGFFARVLQHEIGHLNGELYIDLLTPACRHGRMEEMLAIKERSQQK